MTDQTITSPANWYHETRHDVWNGPFSSRDVAIEMGRDAYDDGASDICELRNDNREANARLIAAAPDLLEALIRARQTILDLKNARWSECEGSDADWVADIDAALAKARQSTPAPDCDGDPS